jgi:hypothetical protein
MFLAFLKLRATDSKTKRVYKVPGGDGLITIITPVLTAILERQRPTNMTIICLKT